MKPAWYTPGYVKLSHALAYLIYVWEQGQITQPELDASLEILRDAGIEIRKQYGAP